MPEDMDVESAWMAVAVGMLVVWAAIAVGLLLFARINRRRG